MVIAGPDLIAVAKGRIGAWEQRAPVVIAAQRLGVNDVEQLFAWCPRTTVTSTTTL